MFFKYNSKSQAATEFIIILTVVLLVISAVMYATGLISVEVKDKGNDAEVDNFAKSLISEFNLLSKVEGGYLRNVTIPKHLADRFVPEINSSYLILRNNEFFEENSSKRYYYLLPENVTYTLTNDTSGNYYLVVSRNKTSDFNGITLY